jgi:flagellar basal body rod protein FlgG
MPSSNATRNKRRKRKRAQGTLREKNREDLSVIKSMQQGILRQSKVNAREEMKEIARLMRSWTKMKKN